MRRLPSKTAPTPTPTPATRPPAQEQPTTAVGVDWPASRIMDDPTTAGVLHSVWSGDACSIVPSPPGAGKTTLVALLAATLADRAGLRVAVAAQTRAQAAEVAARTGRLTGHVRLAWPKKQPDPTLTGTNAVVTHSGGKLTYPATGGGVVVATTARWLLTDPAALAADVLIVDEAWQATYGDVAALGAFAPQAVLIGDPGQIAPVVTGCTDRWEDSPTGPHVPAPTALMAAHGDALSLVTLRHTWRLGPQTTALIQPACYPDLPFTSRRPPEHITIDGQPVPEVQSLQVPAPAGPGDTTVLTAVADRARALIEGGTLTTTEGTRPMGAQDVAVVLPHVSQAGAVRAMLADHPDALVGTANAIQGMERPAAVALHPLAGYRDANAFGTDPGRACVMLSRHRAHLTVITDPATASVLENADPSPAVETHRMLWAGLTAAG